MNFQAVIGRRAALAMLGASGLALRALGKENFRGSDPVDKASQMPVPSLNQRSSEILKAVMESRSFTGQLPANKVQELVASEGKDVAGLMVALLPVARTYSRPPISNYHVGAVASGQSGGLYLGMNIEIPGHSLGFSVHGEQAALSNAYMHGESGVASISVTAAPCGHCRQFMNEMSPDLSIEILVQGQPAVKLSSLLPMAFGPKDLGFKNGAFPVRQTRLACGRLSDEAARAAVDAAQNSYAPYSQSYSGVSIETKAGRRHNGSYIENAAFNPSLSPLQTALVQLILAGGNYADISRVVLAEIRDAKISQVSVARAVLSTIAPAVELQTVRVARS